MDPLIVWLTIFILSLIALVKGADWLLKSSEKIGLAIGLSPFVIGVLMVSLGTSFPELIAAAFAAFKGITEFAPANAIGSNLANILLVVGFSAIVAGRLVTTKSLINTELPLLAIGTAIFLAIAWDGSISIFEGVIMLLAYGIYVFYTAKDKRDEVEDNVEIKLPSRVERREHSSHSMDTISKPSEKPSLKILDVVFFLIGALLLTLGSKYLIDSVTSLSMILNTGVGIITITAVAIGTSLPELLVSVKAALKKNYDVALGNIFGSNAFNMMVVVGLPAIFFPVELDAQSFTIGLPFLAVTTLLFVISGISKAINSWEGAFYICLYIIFISTLLGFS
ncbi:MAG: calcium/sodium antiporter [Candidatus Paceibacterota bacterium]